MDISWGSEQARKFVTTVGLITSDGPHGPNVMSAEWTHQVSYSPGLIAVCLHPMHATTENIQKSREFGVNIAAHDQSTLASLAGGNKGKQTDKVAALKELGFKFYQAKQIKAPMIEGAALNVECKVVQELVTGDHITFIGEALDVKHNPDKPPLPFFDGKFWKFTETLPKPAQGELDRFAKVMAKHKK